MSDSRSRSAVMTCALALLLVAVVIAVGSGELRAQQLLALLVVFVSGVIGSMAGFAFSAVAGPLLAYLYADPTDVVRVLLVCSITIQTYCTALLVKTICWRNCGPYLVGGVLTAPLGVLLLTQISPRWYAGAFGTMLVVYGMYSLGRRNQTALRANGTMDVVAGALGGLTGGMAAFPGAVPAIRCSMLGLTKEAQRAICQPYILLMQIWTLCWVQYVRPIEFQMVSGIGLFVPISLLAATIGYATFKRLSGEQFRLIILNVLVLSGGALVCKGWVG